MSFSRIPLLRPGFLACGTPDDTDTDDTDVTSEGGMTCDDEGVCILTGTITEDLTLTADNVYLLRGGVFFGDDENPYTLTIEAGTTIFGESDTDGFLVIQRSSRILANGTASDPITFTSSKNDGSRGSADWGGLIINGRAPSNVCPSDLSGNAGSDGEAGTGKFCGDDPTDDSGVLNYVRIQFAGKLVNDSTELNGLALQGVGSGTEIDYVQVYSTADDALEFFGGTVNVKHLVLAGAGDDLFDITDGWTGSAQYVVAMQLPGAGDQGIEADNNEEQMDATPRSAPALANFTIVGAQSDDMPQDAADIGVLLRHGVAGNLSHMIVAGWGEACIDVDSAPTFANAWDTDDLSGALTFDHSFVWCDALAGAADADMFPEVGDSSTEFTNAELVLTYGMGNTVADPGLEDMYDKAGTGVPDLHLSSSDNVSGLSTTVRSAGDAFGTFFDDVDFAGAFGVTGTNDQSDWDAGWTEFPEN